METDRYGLALSEMPIAALIYLATESDQRAAG
jgi:hypothetical protein